MACFEIVDSRIRDWKIKIQDTVADNASCGVFVLGDRAVDPRKVDLGLCGMVLEKNGEIVGTGAGAAALGHPVNAVAWLANTLGRLGIPLKAGEVILSGSLAALIPVVRPATACASRSAASAAARYALREDLSMARLAPLPRDAAPGLEEDFAFFERTLGFVPNSLLTMARRPALVRGLIALSRGVYDPRGEVDLGLKRLLGHTASMAAGCLYCRAHTGTSAMRHGVSAEKLSALPEYRSSPLYSEAERAAIDFSFAAASQPNDVDDALFERLRAYWNEGQIVEISGCDRSVRFLQPLERLDGHHTGAGTNG